MAHVPDAPVIGVALDGAGSHPAAWRASSDRRALADPRRAVALARSVEAAGFDFVAFDDSFDPPDAEHGELPFRFDALLTASTAAAATSRIGVLATVTTTHTEPFHVSKNVATLDHVSHGRAAWRVAVSPSREANDHFGRRADDSLVRGNLLEEAAEVVEVVRRLWDSWEDDAVIRDVATGRYIDRERLHYVDFEGGFFSVRGPSITPRPPQGQPLVAVDVVDDGTAHLASLAADLVLLHERDPDVARARGGQVRDLASRAGRDAAALRTLVVATVGERSRRAELDALTRSSAHEALDVVGDAGTVASTLAAWCRDAEVAGVILRPDDLDVTLDWLAAEVLAQLPRPTVAAGATLRDRFVLPRPANRYAVVRS